MPRKVYPPEYRQQLVELALAGESPEKLAKRFKPSAKTIREWVKAARAGSSPARSKDAEIRHLQKENEILREEREIRKKAEAWFAVTLRGQSAHKGRAFSFIEAHRAEFHITTMLRVLDVSKSGYYAWIKREISPRRQKDLQLLVEIRRIHLASNGTYGARRVHAQLRDEGWRVGKKRVARLMVEAGIAGRRAAGRL